MFYLVIIQRWIFCCNNEASMSVLWHYHGWVTHLYHREIKNFSRFSNFRIVPIFWNNMWGQCIVRNFLCFPSFQKLDNLNPKENREISTIFSNFYLRKTLLLCPENAKHLPKHTSLPALQGPNRTCCFKSSVFSQLCSRDLCDECSPVPQKLQLSLDPRR